MGVNLGLVSLFVSGEKIVLLRRDCTLTMSAAPPKAKQSYESLYQLRKVCKYNMYNYSLQGLETPLPDEDFTYIRVSEEEIRPNHSKLVHRVLLMRPHVYSGGPGWVVDGDTDTCMNCYEVKFGFFNWRHHCRLCGNVVCETCSSKTVDLSNERGYYVRESGASRVCSSCYVAHHFRNAVVTNPNQQVSTTAISTTTIAPVDTVMSKSERMESSENTATWKTAASPSPDTSTQNVVAISPRQQEAPTPTPKKKKNQLQVGPKSILKEKSKYSPAVQVEEEGSEAVGDIFASPSDVENLQNRKNSVENILEKLDGRWDREDDGLSTPGSLMGDFDHTPFSQTPNNENPGMNGDGDKSDSYGYVTPRLTLKSGTPNTGVTLDDDMRPILEQVQQERRPLSTRDMNTTTNDSCGLDLSQSYSPTTPMMSNSKQNNGFKENAADSSLSKSPLSDQTTTSNKFVPVPSFVIKGTIDHYEGIIGNSKTIYINVCKHTILPSPLNKQLKKSKLTASCCIGEVSEMLLPAKAGEVANSNGTVLIVDICYHNNVHDWAYKDREGGRLGALAEHAVVCVNKHYKLNIWIQSLPQYTTYQGNVKPLTCIKGNKKPLRLEAF